MTSRVCFVVPFSFTLHVKEDVSHSSTTTHVSVRDLPAF